MKFHEACTRAKAIACPATAYSLDYDGVIEVRLRWIFIDGQYNCVQFDNSIGPFAGRLCVGITLPVNDNILRLDDQTCFAVYRLSNAITRGYREILANFGLTYPQYVVLMSLWESDGVIIGQISAKTSLDIGTLSPVLKRLAEKGYLTRERQLEDDRKKRILLTEAGKALEARLEAEMRKLTLCFSDQDRALWSLAKDTCNKIFDDFYSDSSRS